MKAAGALIGLPRELRTRDNNGRSLVRARLGWKWANLTVRALSIALPDLSVDTVLATYPHSDPH